MGSPKVWRRGLSLLALLSSSCTADLAIPEHAVVSCSRDADCLLGRVCVAGAGICVEPGVACIERFGDGYRAVADGARCQGEGIADGEGVCVGGSCARSVCGDGVVDTSRGEGCDDGPGNSDVLPNACRTDCAAPACGDGVADDGEECDDGNGADDDACRNTCVRAVCGDGVIYADVEACDDGNLVSTDACLPSCVANVCGDGVLNDGVETCEDLNDNDNDGCAACMRTEWVVADSFGFGAWGGDPLTLGLGFVNDVAVDAFGNVYVSDGFYDVVWRIDAGTGTMRVYAGQQGGDGGDGIPASLAQLSTPEGIALDRGGNLYIADRFGRRVVRVDARTQLLTVVAGGYGCFAGGCGDGGLATAAGMYEVMDVAVDDAGNVYMVDAGLGRVRVVSTNGYISQLFAMTAPTSIAAGGGLVFVAQAQTVGGTSHRVWRWDGTLDAFAGSGAACTPSTAVCGDNGDPLNATLNRPAHLAVDATGTVVLIADQFTYRVRKVQGNVITTIAGNGSASCSATSCVDGVTALSATLASPKAVAFGTSGELLVADAGLKQVKKLTPSSSTFTVTTAAGNRDGEPVYSNVAATASSWQETRYVATGPNGDLFAVESSTRSVFEVDAAGVLHRRTGGFSLCALADEPCDALDTFLWVDGGLAVAPDGDIVVFDQLTQAVRRVDTEGLVTTIAGDAQGAACASAPYSCGDGDLASTARFVSPFSIAVAPDDTVYVVDPDASRIRRIRGGMISTLIGNGVACASPSTCNDNAQANLAQLQSPTFIAVDANGDVYFADGSSTTARVRKIDVATNIVSTVVAAGPATSIEGLAITRTPSFGLLVARDSFVWRYPMPSGSPVAVAGSSSCTGVDGDAATTRCLGSIIGIAGTSTGELFVGDYDGGVLRVDAAGVSATAIGAVDPAGTGPFATARLRRPAQLSPSPDPARWLVADGPVVHALDLGASRLDSVVGYLGGPSADGEAARYRAPLAEAAGVALDSSVQPPALYVSDMGAHRIYRVVLEHPSDARQWKVYAFAGSGTPGHANGAALASQFRSPAGLAYDAAAATLFVADRGNHVIRAIKDGVVTTIAGTVLTPGFDLDVSGGVPADEARFDGPRALAIAPDGGLLIADTGNDQVRRLAGDRVSVVLGDGTPSYVGEGAPARAIPIASPRGLAFDAFGNLLVAAGTTLRIVLPGGDGVVDGEDSVQILYGAPPRTELPEAATTCLAGLSLLPSQDQLLLTDLCSGFFVRLQRQAL